MASEDTVPLMEEVKEQSNIEEQDESIAVTQAPVKKRAFIFQRVTYYWILVVSQFLQATLCIVMYAVSAADKNKKIDKKADLKTLASGIYSIFGLLYAIIMLVSHYKGANTKLNAGRHVALARTCLIIGAVNFFIFFLPVMEAYARVDFSSDDIKRFFIPLEGVLLGLSVFAGGAAVFITKRSAKRALGTAMVHDPNHRVPAWTLATTVDDNSIQLA